MNEYGLRGMIIGLFIITLMAIGLEIANCGGFKKFFKNIFKLTLRR